MDQVEIKEAPEKVVKETEAKKFKFSSKSFSSLQRRLSEMRIKQLKNRYNEERESLLRISNTMAKSGTVKGDAFVSDEINTLARLKVKIISKEYGLKRLEQISQAKPAKLGSNFIARIRQRVRFAIEQKRVKEVVKQSVKEDYDSRKESLFDEIRKKNEISEFDSSFVKEEKIEPVPVEKPVVSEKIEPVTVEESVVSEKTSDRPSSLWGGMFTPTESIKKAESEQVSDNLNVESPVDVFSNFEPKADENYQKPQTKKEESEFVSGAPSMFDFFNGSVSQANETKEIKSTPRYQFAEGGLDYINRTLKKNEQEEMQMLVGDLDLNGPLEKLRKIRDILNQSIVDKEEEERKAQEEKMNSKREMLARITSGQFTKEDLTSGMISLDELKSKATDSELPENQRINVWRAIGAMEYLQMSMNNQQEPEEVRTK